jgi:hypothetical protein
MTNLCGVEFNLGFVLRGQLPFPNYSSIFGEGSVAIGVFRWVGGVFLLGCRLCGYFGSLKYAGTIFCEAADGECAFLVMVCCSTLVWSSNVDVAIFGPRGLFHMPLLDPHSYCIRVASRVVVKPTSWCLNLIRACEINLPSGDWVFWPKFAVKFECSHFELLVLRLRLCRQLNYFLVPTFTCIK